MGSDRDVIGAMRARVLGLKHEGKNVRVELATLGGEAASLLLEPTSDGRGVERLQLGDQIAVEVRKLHKIGDVTQVTRNVGVKDPE